MMPGNLFRLQLAAAFHDRRQVAVRIGVSLLLASPFVFVAMPPRAQAAGIVMVILFTGFFGAAVAHAHLRTDWRWTRLSLLPTRRRTLWLDLVLSSMLMRLGPSLVVLIGFVVVNGRNTSVIAVVTLAGLLCAALLMLTLLGIGTGRLARNNAEVHLFGALATGLLALLSGLAPLPDRLAFLQASMTWNPIAHLSTAVTDLATGQAAVSATEFVFSSFVLIAVGVTAAVRWISGCERDREESDVLPVGIDHRVSKEA